MFTAKERDSETGLDYFGARYMSSAQGRFTSPDPGGGHLEDPQTLNRYAYARNNPLRFTDSTGLDFYLDCKEESDTCHNGNVGNWHNNEKGKLTFEQTRVQGDENGNNLTDQHGVAYEGNFDKNGFHFSSGDKNYTGEFAAGTDPTTLKGAGLFKDFTGVFSSNGLNTNVAQGVLRGTAEQFRTLLKAMVGPNPGFDVLDGLFHPGTTQFRGGNDNGPDPHLSFNPASGGVQGFHFDGAYPYGDLVGFGEHSGSVLKYSMQKLFGTPAPSIPPTLTVPH